MKHLLLLLILLPLAALAQQPAPTPCADDTLFHLLDFWLGEWTVHDTSGALVGTNSIQPTLGGCAITESWSGSSNATIDGRSLFFVNRTTRQWEQIWVTTQANAPGGQKHKYCLGRSTNGAFVFQGQYYWGKTLVIDRTILTPQADGSVQQHIQYSVDGGQNWRTSFLATYRPAG